jgi:hypothetical protein
MQRRAKRRRESDSGSSNNGENDEVTGQPVSEPTDDEDLGDILQTLQESTSKNSQEAKERAEQSEKIAKARHDQTISISEGLLASSQEVVVSNQDIARALEAQTALQARFNETISDEFKGLAAGFKDMGANQKLMGDALTSIVAQQRENAEQQKSVSKVLAALAEKFS